MLTKFLFLLHFPGRKWTLLPHFYFFAWQQFSKIWFGQNNYRNVSDSARKLHFLKGTRLQLSGGIAHILCEQSSENPQIIRPKFVSTQENHSREQIKARALKLFMLISTFLFIVNFFFSFHIRITLSKHTCKNASQKMFWSNSF